MAYKIEPMEIVARMEGFIASRLHLYLNNYSIFLEDTSNTELLCKLLKTLRTVEDYDNPQIIADILEGDAVDDEDTFCNILDEIGYVKSDDFLNSVTRVSGRLLILIRTAVKSKLLMIEKEEKDFKIKCKDRTTIFMGNDDYLIKDLLLVNYPFGREPKLVFDKLKESLFEMKPEKVAKELVAMLLAAKIEDEDIPAKAKEYIEELFEDYHQILAANLKVDAVWKEYLSK